jgi:hypothetical protein
VSHGDVTVKIANDAEGAAASTFAGERLGQVFFEGRADVLLTRWRMWRRRVTPYATLSGGVLRQWHTDNAVIDTGGVIQAGGGLRMGFGPRKPGMPPRFGVAAEVRATHSSGGFHWGREQRTVPSVRLECFTAWGR